jgi:carboxyl-terminal processing protease
VEFAKTRDFSYDTDTELLFEELKKVAEEERYLKGAEKDFEALYTKIKPEKDQDLMKFKDEISEFLENEIVSRYYYQSGRIRYELDKDEAIKKSKEVFNTNYGQILAGK